jgi:hypothetical protein
LIQKNYEILLTFLQRTHNEQKALDYINMGSPFLSRVAGNDSFWKPRSEREQITFQQSQVVTRDEQFNLSKKLERELAIRANETALKTGQMPTKQIAEKPMDSFQIRIFPPTSEELNAKVKSREVYESRTMPGFDSSGTQRPGVGIVKDITPKAFNIENKFSFAQGGSMLGTITRGEHTQKSANRNQFSSVGHIERNAVTMVSSAPTNPSVGYKWGTKEKGLSFDNYGAAYASQMNVNTDMLSRDFNKTKASSSVSNTYFPGSHTLLHPEATKTKTITYESDIQNHRLPSVGVYSNVVPNTHTRNTNTEKNFDTVDSTFVQMGQSSAVRDVSYQPKVNHIVSTDSRLNFQKPVNGPFVAEQISTNVIDKTRINRQEHNQVNTQSLRGPFVAEQISTNVINKTRMNRQDFSQVVPSSQSGYVLQDNHARPLQDGKVFNSTPFSNVNSKANGQAISFNKESNTRVISKETPFDEKFQFTSMVNVGNKTQESISSRIGNYNSYKPSRTPFVTNNQMQGNLVADSSYSQVNREVYNGRTSAALSSSQGQVLSAAKLTNMKNGERTHQLGSNLQGLLKSASTDTQQKIKENELHAEYYSSAQKQVGLSGLPGDYRKPHTNRDLNALPPVPVGSFETPRASLIGQHRNGKVIHIVHQNQIEVSKQPRTFMFGAS